jgi:ATP-dependent protease ClpP protease subunit
MATQIVGSLLALEAVDDKADIRIYINSTGALVALCCRGLLLTSVM